MNRQTDRANQNQTRVYSGGSPDFIENIPPITPLAGAALFGKRVLILSSQTGSTKLAPSPIETIVRQLGAETVQEMTLSELFSPHITKWLSGLRRGLASRPNLLMLSLTATQLSTSQIVKSLLVSFLARLTGQKILIYAPELLTVYQTSVQQFLLRNLISLSDGVLVSDQMQLDQMALNDNRGFVVLSPSLCAIYPPAAPIVRQIQPRVLALASTQDEIRILGAIEKRTRQKYPRAEVIIHPAGKKISADLFAQCDTALIVAPTSYSLEFFNKSLEFGLMPIVPNVELPGLVSGSGIALTVPPLDIEQTSNALCQLVENQALVTNLRAAARQHDGKQTSQSVLQSWADAIHTLFSKLT